LSSSFMVTSVFFLSEEEGVEDDDDDDSDKEGEEGGEVVEEERGVEEEREAVETEREAVDESRVVESLRSPFLSSDFFAADRAFAFFVVERIAVGVLVGAVVCGGFTSGGYPNIEGFVFDLNL